MALKLSFRLVREDYSENSRTRGDTQIKLKLQQILNAKDISVGRIYAPSRNSVKVLFMSEFELNKVLDNEQVFIQAGLTPKITMKLKVKRTVFCAGMDPAFFNTYCGEDIVGLLVDKGWQIAGVYILQNNRGMKIEFKTKGQANKFLKESNTNLGGTLIGTHNKELEIDPLVDQCWGCGVLNPSHGTRECRATQRCLKCGNNDHKFFACSIPRNLEQMNERHRAARFCIPCGTQGSHTSIDHAQCPKKREIVRERVKIARTRMQENEVENERDCQLIRKVFDFTNNEAWPRIGANSQHNQIAAIISLALIDEAVNQGVFQAKLSKGCSDNNISNIEYDLEPGTAREFFNALTGSTLSGTGTQPASGQGGRGGHYQQSDQAGRGTTLASGQSGRGGHYQQKSVTPKVSRFYKDQLGGKRAQYLTSRGEKSRGTPFRIRVHTQNAKQEGTAPTPEVLRNAEHSQEPLTTLLLEESLNLTPCKNASTISDSNVLSESQFFQYYSLGNTLTETEGDPILYHNNLYNPNFDYRDTMDGSGTSGELTGEDNRIATEDNRIAAEKKTREINLNQLQPTDQPRDQRILTSPGPYQGLPALVQRSSNRIIE